MSNSKPEALSTRQNMMWNSAGSIVNLGCQWLISIVIVRLSSGYDAAGVFSLASSVYGIFAPIGQYRMKTYQVSDVKNENSTGEYFSFRLITCSIALILCVAYSLLTCSSDAWSAIILYGAYKTAGLLIEVLHACDQRNFRMDYIGQSLALQGICSLLLFVVVFGFMQSLEIALFAMTLATALIGLLLDFPRTSKFGSIRSGISIVKTKKLLLRCFPIVVAGIASSAAPSLPRQYLASSFGSASLGIYASIASPIAIIQMGASYIYGPLLSYFSLAYMKRNKDEFFSLFAKTTIGIVCVGVISTIGIVLFGESLLVLLYGEGIREYTFLMIPMVPFAMLTGFMWFVNDLLISLRNFRGTFCGGVISLVSAAMVMLPLIGHFEMNGVTFTGLVSCSISLFVMLVLLGVQLRGHFSHGVAQ